MNVIWIKEPYKGEYTASRQEALNLFNTSSDAIKIRAWKAGMPQWILLEEFLFGEQIESNDRPPEFKIDIDDFRKKSISNKESKELSDTKSLKIKTSYNSKYIYLIAAALLLIITTLVVMKKSSLLSEDPDAIKYHYENRNREKIIKYDGVKLSAQQSEELTSYENMIRDYVYSIWELPMHPLRYWKKNIIAEVDKNGIITLDTRPNWDVMASFNDSDMESSVYHMTFGNSYRYNSKGDYLKFPPPAFITDAIPSWMENEYQIPLNIELDSEVIYNKKDLPKTQLREHSMWLSK